MQDRAGPSRFRPGSWDAGIAFGLWVLFMLVMTLGRAFLGARPGDPVVLLTALPAQLLAILLVPLAIRWRTRAYREELGLYEPAAPCFLRGLLDYLWLAPSWWFLAFLWLRVFNLQWPDHKPEQFAMVLLQDALTGSHSLWFKAGVLFVTTIGAAASEELLFRGLFQGVLRRYVAKHMGAVLLGLFFGIVHIQPNLADSFFVVPPLAILGYLLSLVRERPGGLWACILIHATNNALSIVLKYYE